MALVGMRIGEEVRYQSTTDPDRGKPEATIFRLVTLSSRIMARVKDRALRFMQDEAQPGGASAEYLMNEMAYELVRHGLAGWENFKDGEGNDIPFTTKKVNVAGVDSHVVSEEAMSHLSLDLIQELAGELQRVNEPTEEGRKKSES